MIRSPYLFDMMSAVVRLLSSSENLAESLAGMLLDLIVNVFDQPTHDLHAPNERHSNRAYFLLPMPDAGDDLRVPGPSVSPIRFSLSGDRSVFVIFESAFVIPPRESLRLVALWL